MNFHPVIVLPNQYPVFDFSKPYDLVEVENAEFGIGRYNEKRPGIYSSELFQGGRDIHVGIDIFAPVGTAVHAFCEGTVHSFVYNSAELDYGYTLITEHIWKNAPLFVLHGHLNKKSLDGKRKGAKVSAGEIIAWVGDRHENGGWIPHLHFQLSLREPKVPDMPGVVTSENHAESLLLYPDPRLVLGPIY